MIGSAGGQCGLQDIRYNSFRLVGTLYWTDTDEVCSLVLMAFVFDENVPTGINIRKKGHLYQRTEERGDMDAEEND